MSRIFAIAFLAVVVLAGCVIPPDDVPHSGENAVEEQVQPVVDPEPPPEPEPIPEQEPIPEPEPEPIPEPEPEPIPADEVIVDGQAIPIEVPEDRYEIAFAEVEDLIAELNQIIYRGDFDAWVGYLTENYFQKYSDPEVLAAASQQPVLKENRIVLYNLEDYFEFVVVPSRARARLDDLVFYSDTLVEAVSTFRGELAILYLLRQIDGSWKIDTF